MQKICRIGFIGLGAMGKPMAARVSSAGYALTVTDADERRADEVAKEIGATVGRTPAEVASQADIVITMLPSSDVVNKVVFGTDGVLAGIVRNGLILEMSSGVPDITRKIAEAAGGKGVVLVDAPVSGGVGRARTGELAIMFGGDDAAFARAKPILETMGASIIRTGSVGSAHAMKALNNLVSAGGFLIGIEALLIGKRFGLDPALMVDVLNVSTGMNNSTQKKFKQFVLSRKFNAGFGLDLMVKDLGIALGVAEATNTPSPFSSLCQNIWGDAQKALGKGHDHTALARFCESVAESELSGEAASSHGHPQ